MKYINISVHNVEEAAHIALKMLAAKDQKSLSQYCSDVLTNHGKLHLEEFGIKEDKP